MNLKTSSSIYKMCDLKQVHVLRGVPYPLVKTGDEKNLLLLGSVWGIRKIIRHTEKCSAERLTHRKCSAITVILRITHFGVTCQSLISFVSMTRYP